MVGDFRTQYDAHDRIYQQPGSGDKITYSPKLLEDGTIDLQEIGKEDLYGYIQSHRDSCDINVLMARYRNGDVDALNKVQGVYGDFTGMPHSFAEALNAMIAAEQTFAQLPLEVREKFDHSLEKFVVAMDDMPSFLAKIGQDGSSPAPAAGSDSTPAPAAGSEGGADNA